MKEHIDEIERQDARPGSVERLRELKLWLDAKWNRHSEEEDLEAGNAICELIGLRASHASLVEQLDRLLAIIDHVYRDSMLNEGGAISYEARSKMAAALAEKVSP